LEEMFEKNNWFILTKSFTKVCNDVR
jgi:hypothetical protein